MRIIIHGHLDQVAEITPGRLVIEVTSVSEPYVNRKGTPRLYRVYLEGDIIPAPSTDSTNAGSSTTVRRSDQPGRRPRRRSLGPAAPPEIEGGGR